MQPLLETVGFRSCFPFVFIFKKKEKNTVFDKPWRSCCFFFLCVIAFTNSSQSFFLTQAYAQIYALIVVKKDIVAAQCLLFF